MARTLRETIREITRNHLQNGGILLGQTLMAVGCVNGTVPEDAPNIIELPMCDVAGAGFAVGCGLAQKRPIFVERFQDFIELGMSPIVNYAAKSKETFGTGIPMWIRLIADEGHGAGIVHSGRLHSLMMHFPGLKVVAPITPSEYESCWNQFMQDDCPYIVCEHRATFNNEQDINDYYSDDAEFTIYAVSLARMNAIRAMNTLVDEGIRCNLSNIISLKPLVYGEYTKPASGLVVDTGFQTCGASESIAYNIMINSKQKVEAMGLMDMCNGTKNENLTPSAKDIANAVRNIMYEEN